MMSVTIRDAQLAKRPTGSKTQMTGSENQFTVAGIMSSPTSRNNHNIDQHSKSNTGGRARRLVGNVFDSFKRSASKPSTPSALAVALEQQWPLPTEYWDGTARVILKEDHSQTSAVTDSDTSSPMGVEDHFVSSCLDLGKDIHDGVNLSKQKERSTHQSLSPNSAATRLQSVFRGYRQRYEYRMMRLRHKLVQIEALKQRQLARLARRTKSRMRMEKSVAEFHNAKETRQLMRFTRIIPYLFREAQAKLAENVAMCSAPDLVAELFESHQSIQRIAHHYLESLEDLPGIWEALKGQWMAPKKPRPRRVFGPDGKSKKVDPKTSYNTHDEDLPVVTTSQRIVARKDSLPNLEAFEELRALAFAATRWMTNEDIYSAVHQVNAVVGTGFWN
jgi:IQ calmodulin-binding motif